VAPGLVNLSATALARAIRNREISPIEVVEGQLDRIKARNDGNNGSITGMPEAARAAAREADAALASERDLGSLHGVPIASMSSTAAA